MNSFKEQVSRYVAFLTFKADEDIRRETYRVNLRRLVMIGPIFFFMELALLPIEQYLLGVKQVLIVFLIANAVIYPFVYLVSKRQEERPEWLLRLAIYAYILTIVGLGSGLSLKGLMSTDLVHVFLMTVVSISIFFILPALGHLVILLLSIIPYLLIYPHLLIHQEIRFVILNNVIVFTVISWLLGRLVYSASTRMYTDRKILEEQNALLADMAVKDPLTGLLNHGASQDRLRREIEIARDTREQLSIILFDIDDFKGINDVNGHLTGDEVLRQIAVLVKEAVDEDDEVGRYGGDEFIIIMPHTSVQGARVTASKVWQVVESVKIEDTDLSVTLSGGVHTLEEIGTRETDETATEIIAQADGKLFSAKRRGKNRFISDAV